MGRLMLSYIRVCQVQGPGPSADAHDWYMPTPVFLSIFIRGSYQKGGPLRGKFRSLMTRAHACKRPGRSRTWSWSTRGWCNHILFPLQYTEHMHVNDQVDQGSGVGARAGGASRRAPGCPLGEVQGSTGEMPCTRVQK